MDNNIIHIGEIIRDRLKKERRTKKWLAKEVGCDPSNLVKTLQKDYMSTDLLQKISFALKHDFFKYFSKHLAKKQRCKGGKRG